MGDKASTVYQQMNKLSCRGVLLDLANSKTSEILLDIGYYTLGFYKHAFEIDKDHNVKEGTRFSDILSLYYLDLDIRNFLVKYLNRIESNFKTKLIYHISNKYNNDPTWFINEQVVDIDFIDGKFYRISGGGFSTRRRGGFIKSIYTDAFKKKNKMILMHHKNNSTHRFAPAWKTIEYLTFGQTLKLFMGLNSLEDKQIIQNEFKVKSNFIFETYFQNIVDLRNACAHGNVLYDYNTKHSFKSLPFLKFTNNEKHSFGGCIKVLEHIIGCVSENRKEDFNKELQNLIKKNEAQFPVNSLKIKEIIREKMKLDV